jgi:hypothetical protein
VIALEAHLIVDQITSVALVRDWVQVKFIITCCAVICDSSFNAVWVVQQRISDVTRQVQSRRLPTDITFADLWLNAVAMRATVRLTDRSVTNTSLPTLIADTVIRQVRIAPMTWRHRDWFITMDTLIAVETVTGFRGDTNAIETLFTDAELAK